MTDLDALEKLARDVQHNMVGPTSMVISTSDVLRLVAVARRAEEHIESMDDYEGGDLVPMNRTRGTTGALHEALAALKEPTK